MELRRLNEILKKVDRRKIEKGVVHSIDIDRVNLTVGNNPNLLKNVEIIGEPPAPGTEVSVFWINGRPVASSTDFFSSTPTATKTSRGLLPRLSGVGNQFLNGLGNWAQVRWEHIAGKPKLFPPEPHDHEDIAGNDNIILYYSGYNYRYQASEIGLYDAINDASSGCTIFIPAVTLSPIDFELPEGVSMTGLDRENSLIYASVTLSNGCGLASLKIVKSDSGETDAVAVRGPSTGEASIFNCALHGFNCGAGDGVGLLVRSGDLVVRECELNGESASGDGYGVKNGSESY